MKPCIRCRENEVPADLWFCAECCGPELRLFGNTRPKPGRRAAAYSEDADVAAAWRADLADYRPTHRAGRHASGYDETAEHLASLRSRLACQGRSHRAEVAA